MPNCQNCDKWIADEEYDRNRGHCQNCVQYSAIQEGSICQMDNCSSSATSICWTCQKNICTEHTRTVVVRGSAAPRSGFIKAAVCVPCAKRTKIRQWIFRIIRWAIAIPLLIIGGYQLWRIFM